ncbi:MAG: sigma-70 family RNA polymerase sigma factor [Candidatus Paceibacterota bacterium]|jgi:RNA polymerase sigma-70 factor (ECF subfamily)
MTDSFKDKTDEEIAKLVQQGEHNSFAVLIDRYEEKILRYGKKFLSNRDDIVDITQDIFINTYKNLQNFDATKKFSSWIYRMAHNAFINEMKKNTFRPITMFDFDTLVSHLVYEDTSLKEREQEEIKCAIDQCLDKIKPKYKEVLILYYIEDLGYQEISDILEIPKGTVGIRIKRAKEELKKIWQAENKNDE